MPGPQCIMILVCQLDDRTAELGKVQIDEICQLVAGEDSLILEDAHIAPRFDDLGLHIPQSRITEKVCSIMKEARRTYDLSVAGSFDVHHLCRLRTQKHHEAVLVFLLATLSALLLGSGHDREARHDDESSCSQCAEKFHRP